MCYITTVFDFIYDLIKNKFMPLFETYYDLELNTNLYNSNLNNERELLLNNEHEMSVKPKTQINHKSKNFTKKSKSCDMFKNVNLNQYPCYKAVKIRNDYKCFACNERIETLYIYTPSIDDHKIFSNGSMKIDNVMKTAIENENGFIRFCSYECRYKYLPLKLKC